MKIVLAIIVSLLFESCKSKVPDFFIGTWQKDSSTNGPTSRLSRPYESGTLVFNKNGTYNYRWGSDDVFGSDSGKYIITDSVNGLKVLKLEKRSGYYFYYTVLEVDNKRFKAKCKLSYDAEDSTIYYDMIDVFKKIE